MKWKRTQRWSKPRLPYALFGAGFFLLGALLVLTVLLLIRPDNPLPSQIRQQVHFPVFMPTTTAVINTSSFKYDTSAGVLSFTVILHDKQVATFAEQATPDPINDIPGYFDKFLQTLFEYQSFDSLLGTVNLTHPKGAGQAAVMNAKGTLLFVRVPHDEPETIWQQLFSGLTLYQS